MWARERFDIANLAGQETAFTNVLSTFETEYGANLIGCTIIRVRVSAALEGASPITVAFRIATESSIATLTNVSGPEADKHADWMAYQPHHVDVGGSLLPFELDVRSMRKLDELGDTLLMAVSNGDVAANLLDAVIVVSMLVALP